MRFPLSGNKLVALTLIGALLSGATAFALANPTAVDPGPPVGGVVNDGAVAKAAAVQASAVTSRTTSTASAATASSKRMTGASTPQPGLDTGAAPSSSPTTAVPAMAAQPPTPNPNFTPAVNSAPSRNDRFGEENEENDHEYEEEAEDGENDHEYEEGSVEEAEQEGHDDDHDEKDEEDDHEYEEGSEEEAEQEGHDD